MQVASCLHWATSEQQSVLRHESHGVPPTPQPGGNVTSYPASAGAPLLDVEPLDVPELPPELVEPPELPLLDPLPLLELLEALLALPELELPVPPELVEPEEAPDPSPEEPPVPTIASGPASAEPDPRRAPPHATIARGSSSLRIDCISGHTQFSSNEVRPA